MPITLPAAYWVQREAQGSLAILKTHHRALAGLGYGVESDGERHLSELKGRGNLEEFHTDSGVLVIRRFRRGGFARFLSRDRFLNPDRPFEEIRLSETLRENGFHTPVIVAARARRIGILGFQLEVVTEKVEGAKTFGAWMRELGRTPRTCDRWNHLMGEGGRLVRGLHAAGFVHSDLQPENFLFVPEGEEFRAGKTWVLDLDRSKLREPGSLDGPTRAQNIWRLWRYVLRMDSRHPGLLRTTDGHRFLRAYSPEKMERRKMAQALVHLRETRSKYHKS